jgi:hypothetical protein
MPFFNVHMHAINQKILPCPTGRSQIRKLGKQALQTLLAKAFGNPSLGFFPQGECCGQGLLTARGQSYLTFPTILTRLNTDEPLFL